MAEDEKNSEHLTLLIVDEDEAIRMYMRMAFKAVNFNVELDEVAAQAEAIAALGAKHYDCLFVDTQLPDGSGMGLLKELVEMEGDVPIVMMTGARDDHFLWMHDTLHLVQDEQGQALELLGSMVDITSRKEMEEDLRREKEEQQGLIRKLKKARS